VPVYGLMRDAACGASTSGAVFPLYSCHRGSEAFSDSLVAWRQNPPPMRASRRHASITAHLHTHTHMHTHAGAPRAWWTSTPAAVSRRGRARTLSWVRARQQRWVVAPDSARAAAYVHPTHPHPHPKAAAAPTHAEPCALAPTPILRPHACSWRRAQGPARTGVAPQQP